MNSRRSGSSHRRQTQSKVAALSKGRSSKRGIDKIDEFQPKLLRKPENLKDESEVEKKCLDHQKLEVPEMTNSVKLISKIYPDLTSLLPFIDSENSNFYVVGIIGARGSGKTTIMNLIATGNYKICKLGKSFYIEKPPFDDSRDSAINAFITKDRTILLDSVPILFNEISCEFILSDVNDIRQIQVLLNLCHELVIVYESSHIMQLTRMLICATRMMNRKKDTRITLIENRVKPGSSKSSEIDLVMKFLVKEVSEEINLIRFPDITQVAYYHDDPKEIINKLRDDINNRKELKALNDSTETEKIWWSNFSHLDFAGGPLVKQYESLRGRFYQPID